MAKETMKAGRYELLADHFKQITSAPGKPLEFDHFTKGDVVELSAADAERLRDVIAVPGERARQQADRHRAEAKRLSDLADAAEARAKAEDKAAKAPAAGHTDESKGDGKS